MADVDKNARRQTCSTWAGGCLSSQQCGLDDALAGPRWHLAIGFGCGYLGAEGAGATSCLRSLTTAGNMTPSPAACLSQPSFHQ